MRTLIQLRVSRILAACIVAAAVAAGAIAAADNATVVRVSGVVEVIAGGNRGTEPARKGMKLSGGDRIRACSGGHADLIVDGKLHALESGQELVLAGSQDSKPWMSSLMSELSGLLTATEEPTAPGASRYVTGTVQILAPFDTAVTQPAPALEWTPHPGASGGYEIAVRDAQGKELVRHSAKAGESSLTASIWKPERGARYTWTITPKGLTGAKASEAWVEILSASEAAELSSRLGYLPAVVASYDSSAKLLLAQALLYRDYRCFSEARRLLKEAQEQGKGTEWAPAARRCLIALGGPR